MQAAAFGVAPGPGAAGLAHAPSPNQDVLAAPHLGERTSSLGAEGVACVLGAQLADQLPLLEGERRAHWPTRF